MANIWQPPPGGYTDGPGLVCVGSLDANPSNPWGRTNPWAYDGAIYGYRQFADFPFGDVQYSVLGGIISVCIAVDGVLAADKAVAVANLNDGCNSNPFLGGHVLTLTATDGTVDDVWQTNINCTTDGGDVGSVIKGTMAIWGICRDVQTNNDLSRDETPATMAYVVTGGLSTLQLTFATEAAADLWRDVLVPEFIALWIEH